MLLKAINNNSKNKNRTTPCRITHLKRISMAVFKRNEELALGDKKGKVQTLSQHKARDLKQVI